MAKRIKSVCVVPADEWHELRDKAESQGAELTQLRGRVRRLRKALRVARTLTGWSTQSEVDAEIAKILKEPRR